MKRNYQIIIEPYEIGTFKRQHYKQIFLQRLKEQHEGKCMPYGYVESVDKVISYSMGEIFDCDLSGRVVYDVVANVNIKNYDIDEIVMIKLEMKNEGIGAYIAIDEPFTFFVFNKTSTEVDLHTPVKVQIKGKRIIGEDNIIHVVAEIISVKTE